MQRSILAASLGNEIIFSASRSSGAGGQNVNKVNTKVTLKFDVKNSQYLSDEEKEIILKKLATRLTNDGVLVMSSQEKRSQLQNKDAVVLKLEKLLAKAFEKKKARKATKPSKGSVQNRITEKKQQSEKKQWRQKL
ncbi:MAG TPA: alternative ribosome rescue aminoacyl-tRNA hydrolase ArfB [Chryseolinea sp.]|nr:alternative ribosome rescue aminoacyl-tRNA hydrolase ArfB [Chryseolinea sp.]HPH46970.1 alternative ribosome rescue aminoacyl-tRNA hydrolase ArfB [Chryseolinea sp.]HPM30473.1 alternative ribosome rescue aminoacyl-tRNA hydrolase ArfB [Chryseolinea sp.]